MYAGDEMYDDDVTSGALEFTDWIEAGERNAEKEALYSQLADLSRERDLVPNGSADYRDYSRLIDDVVDELHCLDEFD